MLTILHNFIGGFSTLSLEVVLMVCLGVVVGIIFGALPGLTATTAISVFLPVTFYMSPVTAIGFLIGLYVGGIYGGSVTAILINTPGTPASAATALDGYKMAQQGKAKKALQAALYGSTFGGLLSTIILVFVAQIIANVAVNFATAEYFWLGIFGLTIVASLSGKNMVKGLVAACIGLFLGFIGMDPVNGAVRFTFGNITLLKGVQLVPACIGFFAMSEVLTQIDRSRKDEKQDAGAAIGPKLSAKEFFSHWKLLLKSSLIGTGVGAIPATGSTVAAFLAYNSAKNSSKSPETFGEGNLEGVLAAESSNNAVTGGALIPLLTLGIPGDTSTAVMLGALMIQGLTPGPMLFQNQGDKVYGIFITVMIANIAMLLIGKLSVGAYQNVVRIPRRILQPIVFGLCIIGTYAINTEPFDVLIMFIFGFLGYIMQKLGFPVTPTILALILGSMTEKYLRTGLMVNEGSFIKMMSGRWIAFFFVALTIFSILYSVARETDLLKKLKKK